MMRTKISTVCSAIAAVAAFAFALSAEAAVTKTRLGSLKRDDMVVTDVVDMGSASGVDVGAVSSIVERAVSSIVERAVIAARPRRLGYYLWEVGTEGEDYGKAVSVMQGRYPSYHGCTGVTTKRYHGRNLDWCFNKQPSILVRSPATEDHFAAIGISCGLSGLDDDFLGSGGWNDAFYALPFTWTDGMNEHGVVIQQNVVQKSADTAYDSWHVKRSDSILFCFIIRKALDCSKTAREAADFINSHVFILPSSEFHYDFHYLVSDSSSSFIVEDCHVYDGSGVPTDLMTNFRVGTAEYNSDKTVKWDTVEPYGIGLERYNTIRRNGKNKGTDAGIKATMRGVWYTQAYSDPTKWYTEFCDPSTANLTVANAYNNPSVFGPVIAAERARFDSEHSKSNALYRGGVSWHTTHMAIYDKELLTLYLECQERTGEARYFYLSKDRPQRVSELRNDRGFVDSDGVSAIVRLNDMTNTSVRLSSVEAALADNKVRLSDSEEALSELKVFSTNAWETTKSYILKFEEYGTNNYMSARLANERAYKLERWKSTEAAYPQRIWNGDKTRFVDSSLSVCTVSTNIFSVWTNSLPFSDGAKTLPVSLVFRPYGGSSNIWEASHGGYSYKWREFPNYKPGKSLFALYSNGSMFPHTQLVDSGSTVVPYKSTYSNVSEFCRVTVIDGMLTNTVAHLATEESILKKEYLQTKSPYDAGVPSLTWRDGYILTGTSFDFYPPGKVFVSDWEKLGLYDSVYSVTLPEYLDSLEWRTSKGRSLEDYGITNAVCLFGWFQDGAVVGGSVEDELRPSGLGAVKMTRNADDSGIDFTFGSYRVWRKTSTLVPDNSRVLTKTYADSLYIPKSAGMPEYDTQKLVYLHTNDTIRSGEYGTFFETRDKNSLAKAKFVFVRAPFDDSCTFVTRLTPDGSDVVTEKMAGSKSYAMLIIPVNQADGDEYSGFELKASTNNFSEGSMVFYTASSGNDLGLPVHGGTIDNCHLFYASSDENAGHDGRVWNKFTTAMVTSTYFPRDFVVIVDKSKLKRTDGKWLYEGNEEIVWSYSRIKEGGYEKDAGGVRALWHPIQPVRWLSKMPEWASK